MHSSVRRWGQASMISSPSERQCSWHGTVQAEAALLLGLLGRGCHQARLLDRRPAPPQERLTFRCAPGAWDCPRRCVRATYPCFRPTTHRCKDRAEVGCGTLRSSKSIDNVSSCEGTQEPPAPRRLRASRRTYKLSKRGLSEPLPTSPIPRLGGACLRWAEHLGFEEYRGPALALSFVHRWACTEPKKHGRRNCNNT